MAEEVRAEADTALQIVRLYIRGHITIETNSEIKRKVDAAARELDNHDYVFVLQDGRDTGKVDAEARRGMRTDLHKDRPLWNAIFGVPRGQRLFMNALFRASGISSVRFFDTDDAALAWLQKQQQAVQG